MIFKSNIIHISIIPYFDELFEKDHELRLKQGYDFKFSHFTTLNDLLQQSFFFSQNPFSELKKIKKKMYNKNAPKHFMFDNDNSFVFLRKELRLSTFMRNFCVQNNLILYFTPLGGGKGIDLINNTRFFLHSNEKSHTPHIHAKYQGDEISIDLNSFKIKGRFKNKKKEKDALDYAKANRLELINNYKKYTNGIVFDDYFLEENEVE